MLLLKRFARSESAAALLPIALSFMVIMATVGIGIDYARQVAVSKALQKAVDAATLSAAVTDGQEGLDFVEEAEKIFDATYPASYLGSTIIKREFKAITFESTYGHASHGSLGRPRGGHGGGVFSTGDYSGKGEALVPTTVMRLFGIRSNVVTATAEVTNNLVEQTAEIAFAVDITGSMEGARIAALKTSLHIAIELLFGGEEESENLYVSIIPYSTAVTFNVAEFPQVRSWAQTYWQGRIDHQLTLSGGKAYLANRNLDNTISAHVDASNAPPTSELTRFRTPANKGSFPSSVPHNANNGIIDNCRDNEVSPSYATLADPAPMIFAKNTQAPLHARTDELWPVGCTRVNVGVMWGWFTLSPTWQSVWDPARPNLPLAASSGNKKFLVLMTDGDNTVYLAQDTDVKHDDVSVSEVCTAAKAAGITIYTIGFGSGGSFNEPLLISCATTPGHYYHAPTPAQLEDVFVDIIDSIKDEFIYLSK